MNISQKGLDLIKKYEGLHDGDLKQIGLQPKMDPVGIWTEGYGRAMKKPDGSWVKGAKDKDYAYTHATISTVLEAEKALAQDLRVYEAIVAKNIKVPLRQTQFDALVSYVYNTGGSSTLYKLINTNANIKEVETWWTTKYISAQGVVLPGLVKRRKEEFNLYKS